MSEEEGVTLALHLESAATLLIGAKAKYDEAEQLFRAAYTQQMLKETNGNRSHAARRAGKHRNTMLRWLGPSFTRKPVQTVHTWRGRMGDAKKQAG